MRFKPLILVCGADEIGTAVIHRLYRARFRVLLTASDDPLTLLRGNSFAQAAVAGTFEVEGVTVRKAVVTEAVGMTDREVVPMMTADSKSVIEVLNPDIVVDTRGHRAEGEIAVGDASLVIGIGKGFTAGNDCDQVIDCLPGNDMGRIIYRGGIAEVRLSREEDNFKFLIEAGADGPFMPLKRLGQAVGAGDVIASVGSEKVKAPAAGVVSGILQEGVEVPRGAVLFEVDSRGQEDYCYNISERGRAVSGSVLESVVAWVADVGGMPGPPELSRV